MRSPRNKRTHREQSTGSAIIAVLAITALLTLLLVSMLQAIRSDNRTADADRNGEQARLAAGSALSSAEALLLLTTSNHPAYLVGQHGDSNREDACLVLGASNLSSPQQMVPLFSYDLRQVTAYPRLAKSTLEDLLKLRNSTNTGVAVDLNDPALNGRDSGGQPGFIGSEGPCPAPWCYLHDAEGKRLARFAFVLSDESARLNPGLHLGSAKTNPLLWDGGPAEIPISGGTFPVTGEEAERLHEAARTLPSFGALASAFEDHARFRECAPLLTRDPCRSPDLIPASLPEGGFPKYNLNDLATNPAWGRTPYDRATNIAGVIARNLPKFRERDVSLQGGDGGLYLKRLACSMVDSISKEPGPTGPPGGEPMGRDLVPYVTQIAELCTRTSLTATSTTIESRFFAEIWNPTTSMVPSGTAELTIGNRARVRFGAAIASPFPDYRKTVTEIPALRPNEFTVISFPPESTSWISPVATNDVPRWDAGPDGNATNGHQWFEFRWNGRLTDMTRRPPLSPGTARGGLFHLKQSLESTNRYWQIWTVPTYGPQDSEESADEAVDPGSYRFTGDPRSTFLTAYTWKPATNYAQSLWKGINPASEKGQGFVLDPMRTWTSRDRAPVNPVRGNRPSDASLLPDAIPSPYVAGGAGSEAPFVLPKAPMTSIGELGNIYDPAQVDDRGQAPPAGKSSSKFCCGGSRTLRIGQPEFRFPGVYDWDLPGKRAVELLDLFTVTDKGRYPGTAVAVLGGTNPGVPGRINVNTASHAVLQMLFLGVGAVSDRRYPNSVIGERSSDHLATVLEQHRPYEKLSDLRLLTPELVDASTYSPTLSRNIPGVTPPVPAVFDRTREEAFARIIGHCAVQTRVFHIHAVGESLDAKGRTVGRALVEALIRLEPDASGRLVPSLHELHWR
jgi:hypothetical protein